MPTESSPPPSVIDRNQAQMVINTLRMTRNPRLADGSDSSTEEEYGIIPPKEGDTRPPEVTLKQLAKIQQKAKELFLLFDNPLAITAKLIQLGPLIADVGVEEKRLMLNEGVVGVSEDDLAFLIALEKYYESKNPPSPTQVNTGIGQSPDSTGIDKLTEVLVQQQAAGENQSLKFADNAIFLERAAAELAEQFGLSDSEDRSWYKQHILSLFRYSIGSPEGGRIVGILAQNLAEKLQVSLEPGVKLNAKGAGLQQALEGANTPEAWISLLEQLTPTEKETEYLFSEQIWVAVQESDGAETRLKLSTEDVVAFLSNDPKRLSLEELFRVSPEELDQFARQYAPYVQAEILGSERYHGKEGELAARELIKNAWLKQDRNKRYGLNLSWKDYGERDGLDSQASTWHQKHGSKIGEYHFVQNLTKIEGGQQLLLENLSKLAPEDLAAFVSEIGGKLDHFIFDESSSDGFRTQLQKFYTEQLHNDHERDVYLNQLVAQARNYLDPDQTPDKVLYQEKISQLLFNLRSKSRKELIKTIAESSSPLAEQVRLNSELTELEQRVEKLFSMTPFRSKKRYALGSGEVIAPGGLGLVELLDESDPNIIRQFSNDKTLKYCFFELDNPDFNLPNWMNFIFTHPSRVNAFNKAGAHFFEYMCRRNGIDPTKITSIGFDRVDTDKAQIRPHSTTTYTKPAKTIEVGIGPSQNTIPQPIRITADNNDNETGIDLMKKFAGGGILNGMVLSGMVYVLTTKETTTDPALTSTVTGKASEDILNYGWIKRKVTPSISYIVGTSKPKPESRGDTIIHGLRGIKTVEINLGHMLEENISTVEPIGFAQVELTEAEKKAVKAYNNAMMILWENNSPFPRRLYQQFTDQAADGNLDITPEIIEDILSSNNMGVDGRKQARRLLEDQVAVIANTLPLVRPLIQSRQMIPYGTKALLFQRDELQKQIVRFVTQSVAPLPHRIKDLWYQIDLARERYVSEFDKQLPPDAIQRLKGEQLEKIKPRRLASGKTVEEVLEDQDYLLYRKNSKSRQPKLPSREDIQVEMMLGEALSPEVVKAHQIALEPCYYTINGLSQDEITGDKNYFDMEAAYSRRLKDMLNILLGLDPIALECISDLDFTQSIRSLGRERVSKLQSYGVRGFEEIILLLEQSYFQPGLLHRADEIRYTQSHIQGSGERSGDLRDFESSVKDAELTRGSLPPAVNTPEEAVFAVIQDFINAGSPKPEEVLEHLKRIRDLLWKSQAAWRGQEAKRSFTSLAAAMVADLYDLSDYRSPRVVGADVDPDNPLDRFPASDRFKPVLLQTTTQDGLTLTSAEAAIERFLLLKGVITGTAMTAADPAKKHWLRNGTMIPKMELKKGPDHIGPVEPRPAGVFGDYQQHIVFPSHAVAEKVLPYLNAFLAAANIQTDVELRQMVNQFFQERLVLTDL